MNSQIFISYRRNDTRGSTGRLYDYLIRHFSSEKIFMDVDTIAPGDDFVEVIEKAVSKCDVFVAVIGRNWLKGLDDSQLGKLENSNDFVRIEIKAALKRNIR